MDPAFIFETDSDGNEITTVQLRARWNPRPRIGVRLDSYLRHARQEGPAPERTAQGVTASLTTYLAPGWVGSGGVGVSGSDAPAEGATPNVFASVSTPRRYSIGASLAYAYGPFDATALLIERGVTLGEISLAARAEPSAGWTLSLGLALGSLTGTESNTRTVFKVAVTRLLAPLWTLGGRLKAFGYERDVNDGYFDPDLYWLLELPLRWRRQLQRFAIVAEIAPGLQQVGSDGSAKAALLAYSRVGYTLAPGRELGIGLTYSHSGASAFATDAADYRYFSINAGGTFTF